MIDAASQVLLSLSSSPNSSSRSSSNSAQSSSLGASRNSVDKSSATPRSSREAGVSFSEYYDKSKSDSDKIANDGVSKNNQSQHDESRVAESRSNSSKSESSTENERNESRVNNSVDKKDNGAVENQSDPEKLAGDDSSSIDQENAPEKNESKSFIEADLKENIEAELEKITASINEDILKVDGEEIAVDSTLLNLVTVDSKAQKVDGTVRNAGDIEKELKQNIDKLMQINDKNSKASDAIEKADSKDGTSTLTRQQILEGIQKILDKDKLAIEDASAKLLKPELAVNVNANKVLSEHLKTKDLNGSIPLDLDSELALEGEGDEMLGSMDSTDSLLEKMIERLDFSKLKGELKADLNLQSRVSAEKSSISEFVDQLSMKMSNESSVGSLFSQANNGLNKPGGIPAIQQFTMNTQLNQPEWGTDFSKRIQFMVNNDIKNAELRLDPPELGRINIKISMNQDQANVVFTSAHGNVRDSIENTLPRLRELLQESGIQLGDANINEKQHKESNHSDGETNLSGPSFSERVDDVESEDTSRTIIQHSVDGVIDYFA